MPNTLELALSYCQVEHLDNNKVLSACFTNGIVAGVGMQMPLCTYNHQLLELVNGLLKHFWFHLCHLCIFVFVHGHGLMGNQALGHICSHALEKTHE